MLTIEDRAEEDVLAVTNGGRPQQILVLKKLSDRQKIIVRKGDKLMRKEDFVFDNSE